MPRKQLKPAESVEAAAVRLLGRRDCGSSELRRKLIGKGFSAGEVDGVITQLDNRGLLNDWKLAQRLAGYFGEKLWGPQKLLQKLVQRGIPFEIAREVMDREEESGRTPERL